MNKVVGIVEQRGVPLHSASWNRPWIEYCENNGITFIKIDPLDHELINSIRKVDILLWHLNGFEFQEMLIAKSVIQVAEEIGIKVFPSSRSSWFFDDKISEFLALKAIGAPIPNTEIFLNKEKAKEWVNNIEFKPVIAKLRNGSGSHNIVLLKSRRKAIRYIKKMFNNGLNSSPSLLFKASSNIRSSNSKEVFLSRFKKIPDFLRNLKSAKSYPREKGYVFFQELVPNDGFDLKIITVGKKVGVFGRSIRKNDFRASGGGSVIHDKEIIPNNVINSALETSGKLGVECMGYDYVIDKNNGIGKIIEMSFGFSYELLLEADGYFNESGEWIAEPLNAPKEILSSLYYEE